MWIINVLYNMNSNSNDLLLSETSTIDEWMNIRNFEWMAEGSHNGEYSKAFNMEVCYESKGIMDNGEVANSISEEYNANPLVENTYCVCFLYVEPRVYN